MLFLLQVYFQNIVQYTYETRYLHVMASIKIKKFSKIDIIQHYILKLAVLAQMVACLPLVQQVRGSIPGRVVNFHLKIFNLGARRGGDVHFLIARLYITSLD